MEDTNIWLNSEMIKLYEILCKKRVSEREAFIKLIIDNKLNTFHKFLFKINKGLIKKVLTQVVCGERYGVKLYGKINWIDEYPPTLIDYPEITKDDISLFLKQLSNSNRPQKTTNL